VSLFLTNILYLFIGLLVLANYEDTAALQAHPHSADGDEAESSYGKNYCT